MSAHEKSLFQNLLAAEARKKQHMKEKRFFEGALGKAMNKPRLCLNPSCGMPAINSHIIQKGGGVLTSIANDRGAVMERSPAILFMPRRFVRRSIKSSDVLSFVGFCGKEYNNHDKLIFSEIEDFPLDFGNYWHNLLMFYRAHVAIVRKGVAWKEAYESLLAIDNLSPESRGRAEVNLQRILAIEIVANDIKSLLEREIFSPRGSIPQGFGFYSVKLPVYFPIAASSSFNMSKLILPGAVQGAYYLGLIPVKGVLNFVLGYQLGAQEIEGYQIDSLDSLPSEVLYKIISDILIKYMDTWCISVSFFEHLEASGKIDEIMMFAQAFRDPAISHLPMPGHLFEGLI